MNVEDVRKTNRHYYDRHFPIGEGTEAETHAAGLHHLLRAALGKHHVGFADGVPDELVTAIHGELLDRVKSHGRHAEHRFDGVHYETIAPARSTIDDAPHVRVRLRATVL